MLTEEEYLDIADALPYMTISIWTMTIRINLSLRWVPEAIQMLLERLNLDDLSYELRHKANTRLLSNVKRSAETSASGRKLSVKARGE